jgi:hypothetical protein
MEFGETERDGHKSSPYDSGYQRVPPPHHNYSAGSYDSGQKISWQPANKAVTATQRLILAIVSLVLFLGAFMMATAVGFLSHNSFIQFIAILGLIFFFVIVIVINALFNRKQ